jgi:hypothetical protein
MQINSLEIVCRNRYSKLKSNKYFEILVHRTCYLIELENLPPLSASVFDSQSWYLKVKSEIF